MGELSAADDPRLVEALQTYLEALEAGRPPGRREFLTRYPGIAADLEPYLAGLDLLDGAARAYSSHPSAGVPAAAALEALRGGTPLGDFRLLREVGPGGMGIVYEAEQLSLTGRRRPQGPALCRHRGPAPVAALPQQWLAIAPPDHPHIVEVHAVGCERGVHYHAMRDVDGQSVAEVIAGLRQWRSADSGPAHRDATASVVPPGCETSPWAELSTSGIPTRRRSSSGLWPS